MPQPEHGVYTVFVELPNTKLELLSPLGEKSPIQAFLNKNKDGGMHHICIEVKDIEKALKSVKKPENDVDTIAKVLHAIVDQVARLETSSLDTMVKVESSQNDEECKITKTESADVVDLENELLDEDVIVLDEDAAALEPTPSLTQAEVPEPVADPTDPLERVSVGLGMRPRELYRRMERHFVQQGRQYVQALEKKVETQDKLIEDLQRRIALHVQRNDELVQQRNVYMQRIPVLAEEVAKLKKASLTANAAPQQVRNMGVRTGAVGSPANRVAPMMRSEPPSTAIKRPVPSSSSNDHKRVPKPAGSVLPSPLLKLFGFDLSASSRVNIDIGVVSANAVFPITQMNTLRILPTSIGGWVMPPVIDGAYR
ncbi:unnamed protein product, partial [Mesorhabditis spiculigera]